MRSTRKQLLLHRLQASLQQGLPLQVSCRHSLYCLLVPRSKGCIPLWDILPPYTAMRVLVPLIEEQFHAKDYWLL